MTGDTTSMPNAVDITSVRRIGHREASTIAATEFGRVIDMLRDLDPEDWLRPTACELWDVRAIAGHILGMAEAQASIRVFVDDFRAAKSRDSGALIDAVTAKQVRERAALTAGELLDRLASVAPRAVRARERMPWPVRHGVRFRQDGEFEDERWTLGFIMDVVLTRDRWMHRVDIGRASDTPIVLTREHDGRLVADVVVDWARRHGRPFSLTLTGLAGGIWQCGKGGEQLELDAIEFCRTLSGRRRGQGLLATSVPF